MLGLNCPPVVLGSTAGMQYMLGGITMKKTIGLSAFCLVLFAPLAGAYEYPLQFNANPGYRGLVVAGYQFLGTDVVGNCSYYTVSGGGSGKGGGGGHSVKHYDQTCTWDMNGNLLSVAPGAPVVPSPLYTTGTQTVYALGANGLVTGSDSKLPGHGFVSSPGGHYTWLTPMTTAVIRQSVYNIEATLKSDGDVPVDISAVVPNALNGKVTLVSTTCTAGPIKVGDTCDIQVAYDPTLLAGSNWLAYDTVRIDLTSDAAASHDFVQNYPILLPRPDDN